MKHNYKVREIFSTSEWIANSMIVFIFFLLGGWYLFLLPMYGLFFMVLGVIIFLLLVFQKLKKLFTKVYRIEVHETNLGTKPRLYKEFWLKEDVLELDKEFFWLENNKYTPFICDLDGDLKPIYPFIKGKTNITSGQLYRSLVQKATDMLMKPEKSDLMKAIETGALMLLAGGGALIIISLMSQILAPEVPVNGPPL